MGWGFRLLLGWWLCLVFDATRTREPAQALDEPSVVLVLGLLLANAACVVAIAVLMRQSRGLAGLDRALLIGLSAAALVASWFFIQTIFAFHYAHRFTLKKSRASPIARV